MRLAALAALLLLSATPGVSIAQQVPVQIPRSPSAGALAQGPWQWLGSDYGDGSSTRPSEPIRYTIEFRAAGALTAQADCNTVLGTFSETGAELSIQLGPSTLVACPPGSLAEEFKRDLSRVTGFTQTSAQLVLRLGTGADSMTFVAIPPPDAPGQVWQVNSVNNGREAVVSVDPQSALTLLFGPDDVSGNSGCNQFRGPYTRVGDRITLGPLVSTRKACAPDIMQQEAQYLAALEASTTLSQHGNQLWLADADGATQVILIPAAAGA